jgi:hypothetical protein
MNTKRKVIPHTPVVNMELMEEINESFDITDEETMRLIEVDDLGELEEVSYDEAMMLLTG